MGKPDAPEPTPPTETAAAQTASNVSTAIAQQMMNNTNQVTPYGSLTYSQTGIGQITDAEGNVHDIPTYTATQTLSPAQQALLDGQLEAGQNLTQLAVNQTGRLDDLLSDPLDVSGLPDRQTYADIARPEMQGYGSSASLADILNGRGDIASSVNRGNVQSGMSAPQDYVRGVNVPGLRTSVQSTGTQRGTIDDAGQIQTGARINRITSPGMVGATVNPSFYNNSFASAGNVQSSAGTQGVRDAGAFNPVDFNYQGSGVSAGEITKNIGPVAPASREIGETSGSIQHGFGDVGDVQTSFGRTAGNIQYGYGGDFSEERDEVQQALIDRMSPYQQRDLEALEARLASQGLSIGSSGYQNAMDDYNRSVNDSRLSAILAGGQEQSRLVGMERDRAVFNNNAQQQEYLQRYQRAQLNNAAVAQRYNQEMGRVTLNNTAQAQDFGQQQARAGFAANQQQREFDQEAARAGFSNNAQAQAYAQGADGANRDLQAAQSDLQAQTTNANLGLQSSQQGINRDLSAANLELARAGFTNDAQRQIFDQALARGEFANEAEAMRFANDLAAQNFNADNQRFNINTDLQAQMANRTAGLEEAAFNNSAQQQQFNQNQERTNTFNDASTQELVNELASTGFSNNALADIFGMGQTNANLNNDTLATMFGQDLAAGTFNNAAQNQDFNQQITAANLNNQAQAQDVDQLLSLAGLTQSDINNDRAEVDQTNAILGDAYGREVAADIRTVDQNNQQRDAALAEMFALRNQPINEIAALLGGGQVTNPNFINTPSAQMAGTDIAGLIAQNDQIRQQQYQADMAARQSLFGGILGLGASALTGGFF